MVCLSADDLRLTAAELGEVARLRGKALDAGAAAHLHERAGGWAAAAVLLVEHDKLSGARTRVPPDSAPRAVFDYLAGEIFERFDPATRQLLLQVVG